MLLVMHRDDLEGNRGPSRSFPIFSWTRKQSNVIFEPRGGEDENGFKVQIYLRRNIKMKCGNCHYGEHYILDIDEEIELVQCPFGDNVFRFPDKRCAQFPKRKEAERRDGYVEEIDKTDRR